MTAETITTQCAIAGGGPAGMMLGFLLARAGIDVVVLEKHADFFRDFRGDTIHPSTLEIMYELGILDDFLKRPHQEVRTLAGQIGDERVILADFSHLPTHCRFIALMPQWDFLDFLAEQARRLSGLSPQDAARASPTSSSRMAVCSAFKPRRRTDRSRSGPISSSAPTGVTRMCAMRAGLKVEDFGAPMDVLWFRLSKHASDGQQLLGRIQAGVVFVTLDRGDYWQCAYVIPKGGFEQLRSQGPRSVSRGHRRPQP